MDLDEAGIEAAATAQRTAALRKETRDDPLAIARATVSAYLSRCPSTEHTDSDSWRCTDCNCVNSDDEAFCFRCGAGQPEFPARPSPERDTEKLSRLRSALERVESHGSGIAVTIAREALAEFTAPKADER